jgi:hypothetical protein
MKRGAGLALAAVIAAAAPASAAQAGTYTVYGCSTPDGRAAPIDGWIGTSSPGPPNWTGHANYCSGADPYFVMDHELPPDGTWPAGSAARYTFTAPPGTTVSSAVVRRRYSGSSAQVMAFRVGWRDQWPEWCTAYTNCHGLDGDRAFSGIDNPTYVLEEICGGPSNCTDTKTITSQIRRVATTLADPAAPSFASPPSGTLLEPGRELAGRVGASLPLRDDGGGLRAVRLEVDGALAGSWAVDGNGGRCTEPYVYTVPCKLAATAIVDWDSNSVPDGTQQTRLLVDDAAGNVLAHGPFQIRVRNTPTSCGERGTGLRVRGRFRRDGRRATVRRGRAVRITGRVTAAVRRSPARTCTSCAASSAAAQAPERPSRPPSRAPTGATRCACRPVPRARCGSACGPAGPQRASRAPRDSSCASARRSRSAPRRVTWAARGRCDSGAGCAAVTSRRGARSWCCRGARRGSGGRSPPRGATAAGASTSATGSAATPGRYPVRALVPEEAAYPFAPGTSRPVAVVVG